MIPVQSLLPGAFSADTHLPIRRTAVLSKRPEAERAGEWWMHEILRCVVTRRALRTKFAKVDFFAADIIGKLSDGACVYAQVTAGGNEALRTRRRKLEKVPWHPSERVMVLQLTSTQDPANKARKLWHFRVHNYDHMAKKWQDVYAVPVKKEWFKAWKEPEEKGSEA